jgi:hypothetical protein
LIDASVSRPHTPDTLGIRRTAVPLPWRELAAAAAVYLAVHLAFLAPSLEDIDSINFALGLREFDPARHQPHPPGYPVYIALGRGVLAAVRSAAPSLPQAMGEALALSLLAAIAGAAAVLLAGAVFGALARVTSLDARPAARTTRWATILLAVSPLFWLTGARPMSDVPGLAVALGTQAALLFDRIRLGAFLCGLALGVRSQTVWLTAPLLLLALARRRAWRPWFEAAALGALGIVAWAIPLLAATGGLAPYLQALRGQAGEDFAFVDMLWSTPTPRRLALGLYQTFVLPWASPSLALLVLLLALAGAAVMVARDRRAFLTLVTAFTPYAMFHLVFQETVTVRYALPALLPVVFLAGRALAASGPAANVLAAPLAALALLTSAPGLVMYAREPHPAFRAIGDAARRAEDAPPGLMTSHFELRRPLEAAGPIGAPVVLAPRNREWLVMGDYWKSGRRDVVWFLANPRRTDLAHIDPRSRTNAVRYRWPVEARPELSGTRPAAVDWYRLEPPGWFLGEGWSLTAETGGVTQATGTGPDRREVTAYVLCRPGPMHLVIGGRRLGEASQPQPRVTLSGSNGVLESWAVTGEERNFLRFIDLPRGLACEPGSYAELRVRAKPDSPQSAGDAVAAIAIRQFDVQPAGRLIVAFGEGWHEDEYEAGTGRHWRWASDRAVLEVRAPATDVRVRIRGESPLEYFDAAPVVTLSAAGRAFGRIEPAADFELEVTVPAAAVREARGAIVLETSRSFVPAHDGGSTDTRRLGLRIFDVRVESAR